MSQIDNPQTCDNRHFIIIFGIRLFKTIEIIYWNYSLISVFFCFSAFLALFFFLFSFSYPESMIKMDPLFYSSTNGISTNALPSESKLATYMVGYGKFYCARLFLFCFTVTIVVWGERGFFSSVFFYLIGMSLSIMHKIYMKSWKWKCNHLTISSCLFLWHFLLARANC